MAEIKCIVNSCAYNVDGKCKLKEIKITANDNGEFARRANATKCQSFVRQ